MTFSRTLSAGSAGYDGVFRAAPYQAWWKRYFGDWDESGFLGRTSFDRALARSSVESGPTGARPCLLRRNRHSLTLAATPKITAKTSASPVARALEDEPKSAKPNRAAQTPINTIPNSRSCSHMPCFMLIVLKPLDTCVALFGQI